ncbi:AtpZ/AtpI family protein [Risungbinella massiliensis]|uniref:AtpZ/AtpI family protein n=1 Tax=Risungbinella massiliensis TaxID=1329796 RepID=UPI0005CC4961|nr:AtpZ/AtpI family protein [Risungbinella massiliensis]
MKTDRRILRMLVLVGSISFQMIFLIVGATWLGTKLDALWQSKPTFTLIGVLLGILFGLISAIYTLVRMTKD